MIAGRHYVIDQNVMRGGQVSLLPDKVKAEVDSVFLVPDVLFEEIIRSEQWESTLRSSLALLSCFPERIRMACDIWQLINVELHTLSWTKSSDWLRSEYNDFVRELLQELSSCVDGPTVRKLLKDVPEIRKDMLAAHLNPIQAKQRMVALVDSWEHNPVTVSHIKSLRGMPIGEERDARRLAIVKHAAYEIAFSSFKNIFSTNDVEAWLDTNPLVLRYFCALLLESLRWAENRGLQNAAPKRVQNNHSDLQYAIVATYFDGLLTVDNDALTMHNNLNSLADMTRPIV